MAEGLNSKAKNASDNLKNIKSVTEWTKGNEKLFVALQALSDNGINIISYSEGKSIMDNPYIAIEMTDSSYAKVVNLINEFSKVKSSHVELAYSKNKQSVVILSGNVFNKSKCFTVIAENCRKMIDDSNCSQIVESMINLHNTLKEYVGEDRAPLLHSINYTNGIFGKSLLVKPHAKELEKLMKDVDFKDIKSTIYRVYTARSFTSEEILANKLDFVAQLVLLKFHKI